MSDDMAERTFETEILGHPDMRASRELLFLEARHAFIYFSSLEEEGGS